MFYVFAHMWLWIAVAFVIGCLVGWKTCAGKKA